MSDFDTRSVVLRAGNVEHRYDVNLLRPKVYPTRPAFDATVIDHVVAGFVDRWDLAAAPTTGIGDYVTIAHPRASLEVAATIAKWQMLARFLCLLGERGDLARLGDMAAQVLAGLFEMESSVDIGAPDYADAAREIGIALRTFAEPEWLAPFRDHVTGWLLSFIVYNSWGDDERSGSNLMDDESMTGETHLRVLELISGLNPMVGMLELSEGYTLDDIGDGATTHCKRMIRHAVRQVIWSNEIARCCIYDLHDSRELGFVADLARRNKLSVPEAVGAAVTMLNAGANMFGVDADYAIVRSADFRAVRFVESLWNLVAANQLLAFEHDKYASANKIKRRRRKR